VSRRHLEGAPSVQHRAHDHAGARPLGGRAIGVLVDAEERHHDQRDSGGERAERGAVAAVADDHGRLGEHRTLRHPLLHVHVGGQRSELGEVSVLTDREQDARG
jgi:hypothetical protein